MKRAAALVFPFAFAAFAGGCTPAYVSVGGSYTTRTYADYGEVYVHRPPPPAYSEYVPPPPAPGYVWVSGYWDWTGYDWYWVHGLWTPARAGWYYARPRVVVVNGRYVTDVSMAGSESALFDVVNNLAARETPAG